MVSRRDSQQERHGGEEVQRCNSVFSTIVSSRLNKQGGELIVAKPAEPLFRRSGEREGEGRRRTVEVRSEVCGILIAGWRTFFRSNHNRPGRK